ncbi:MAG: hypothetical protein CMJ48_14435 [Planctomycetaceae bacterium]|nr:hypothetical protein [Planctomycetaceae bacterium]
MSEQAQQKQRTGRVVIGIVLFGIVATATYPYVLPQTESSGDPQSADKATSPPRTARAPIPISLGTTPEIAVPAPDAAPTPEDPDTKRQRWFIGRWHTSHQADRTLTVNEDGTGLMTVKLGGIGSFLFGNRMDIEISWSIEDGKMTHTLLGGKPASKVATMKRMFGDVRTYNILSMTEQSLEIVKENGESQHTWTRLPDESQTAGKTANGAQSR